MSVLKVSLFVLLLSQNDLFGVNTPSVPVLGVGVSGRWFYKFISYVRKKSPRVIRTRYGEGEFRRR